MKFESYNNLKVLKGVVLVKPSKFADRTIIIQVEEGTPEEKCVYITTAHYKNRNLDSYDRETIYNKDIEENPYKVDEKFNRELIRYSYQQYQIIEMYHAPEEKKEGDN